MKLNSTEINKLCMLAIKATKSAGELITSHNNTSIDVLQKEAGDSLASQIVTEVDFKSQELILKILQPSINAFDLGLLTEESPDSGSRFKKDYFWCIDPLDGTLLFSKSKPGYAVSIALVASNGIPELGVVYDPVEQNLYHAIRNHGAYKNKKKWQLPEPEKDKALQFYYNESFKSSSYFSNVLKELENIAVNQSANGIYCNTPKGAVMNACSVLENVPSCYFTFPKNTNGGGSLWDYAATACIYNEIGGFVSDIFGNPLDLNSSESTFMNEKGILFASSRTISNSIQELYINLK